MDILNKYFDEFTPTQTERFAKLHALYAEWNEKINVISRKDIDHLYEKHILHSLAIATTFNFTSKHSVLDLGTGGGFPGVPLAIMFPQAQFLLVDSIGKKLKVIDAICEELQLTNVRTMHTRVEDVKNEKFNYVVSRAVAPLRSLWFWCNKHIAKNETAPSQPTLGNGLICLKGGDLAQEIHESGLRPMAWHIHDFFTEDFFNEKYMLFVPR
jgi:16S rRNA (guanine527-N7)-methyltransferase